MTDDQRGLSRRSVLRGAAVGGLATATSLGGVGVAAAADIYRIRLDQPRQTLWGLGFEIQSDSIGSGSSGLPASTSSVPFDLTAAERDRLVEQMLKVRPDRGFRYCRLALGLYLRGTNAAGTQMTERFSGQAAGLASLIADANIEGVSAEYWSPAPAWKSNNSFIGGTLRATDGTFLDQFTSALATDVRYLRDHGNPVRMWGLQNEPEYSTSYSSCTYTDELYYQTFRRAAPKIHAIDPSIIVTADSSNGWSGKGSAQILADPTTLAQVDAWTYHRIGYDSNYQIDHDFVGPARGKTVFNNEFEYLDNNLRCVNTAQSIMNWMTFQSAPTWFWLHALKPTTNSESPGYGLGYWRPPADTDFSRFPDIAPGHWVFNDANWNAVAGFVRFMPWDSRRIQVDEPAVLKDQRIMAWTTPQGKPVFAVTNRSTTQSFSYTVDTSTWSGFSGFRYGPTTNTQPLGSKPGPVLNITVPADSIEFWVRN